MQFWAGIKTGNLGKRIEKGKFHLLNYDSADLLASCNPAYERANNLCKSAFSSPFFVHYH